MLTNIRTPEDIKGLTPKQRIALAQELRGVIIETVSNNGGHLASNLGMVELTIALHTALNAPEDKLVFDVGHQTYAHKLLTGRCDRFFTLRQHGGITGFLRPDESPYDVCATGHASSGISTALGLARARDLMGARHAVAVVVGDGALTGGMCYEALNDAGQSKTPLIVVLNDNEMSISKNTGALSGYLTGLRQSGPYRSVKRALREGLSRMPHLGTPVLRVLTRLRDALRSLLIDGQFFEALGFEYQGPIDGHDTERLIRVLRRAVKAQRPVLVHVVTKKGLGYAYAEQRPDDFHGIAPFFVDTGRPASEGAAAYGAVMASELGAIAELDARVCAVTAAMPSGTGLTAFQQRFPERTFDVGIAEAHAVSMAAGLALAGMRPFVAIYSTFLQRAYDQLISDVCLQRLPVTLLIDRAGLVGSDGATHQGAFDLCYLCAMPGMAVAAPRDARDLRRLMRLSLTLDGPLAIRYPRDACDMGPGMQERTALALGEWETLAAGRDAVILAVGRMVETALAVSIELHGKGLGVGVVDARFIKPLDTAMLKRLSTEALLLVTLEEGVLAGGLGAAVLRQLADWNAPARVMALGLPDRFVEQGTVAEQLGDCGLTMPQIAEAIRSRLQEDLGDGD
ncbi:MAG: 1-deoxy-D-xylulose-5-phosphate synthase [Christensenellaceae bacterium]|nr:1-deoxy-D-xylulose-5-phosphate synthase [Christensenellaceae bacterium]